MVTIDFNRALLDSKGAETQQKLNELVADLLLTESKGNVRKFYAWGIGLANGNPLVLDKADQKVLSELIENNERLIILAKGQILDILDEAGKEA